MSGTCSITGCDRPVLARGWRHYHYQRWQRYGDPTAPRRQPTGPRPREVTYHVTETGCHLCTSHAVDGAGAPVGGHGRISRQVYQATHGEIPAGAVVRRSCRTPGCINPEHLYLEHRPGEDRRPAFRSGPELRALREAAGVGIQRLAAASGLNVSDLSQRERGLRPLNRGHETRFLAALEQLRGVPVNRGGRPRKEVRG